MKRLSVLLIAALLAAGLGGCRFAVVEGDAIRVFGGSALAEDERVFEAEKVWDRAGVWKMAWLSII